MNIDYSESVKVQYFSINNLPNELTDEYKEFIEQYIEMYLK